MKKKPWSPAEEAELRSLYPDTSTDALCAVFGRGKNAIAMKAQLLGLSKSAAHLKSLRRSGVKPTKRRAFIDACRDLLERPTGSCLAEMVARTGAALTNAKGFLFKAVAAGELHKVGVYALTRYFLTAEAAEAGAPLIESERRARQARAVEVRRTWQREHYRAKHKARPRMLKTPKPPKPIKVKAIKPPKPPNVTKPPKVLKLAPMQPADARKRAAVAFKSQVAGNLSDIKVQRLPGIERVYAQPRNRVVGGFAASGIGSYGECSAWAAAASSSILGANHG